MMRMAPWHLGHHKGAASHIFWIRLARFLRQAVDDRGEFTSAGVSSSQPAL
jgi:hypothetical protein